MIDDRAAGTAGGDVRNPIVEWFIRLITGRNSQRLSVDLNRIGSNKYQDEAILAAQRKAENVDQYPFIMGARNKSAMGQTIPYLLGEMYNTPLKLTDGFYTLSGEYGKEQYYHCVFTLGYGRQKITKLLLGNDVLLQDNNGLMSKEYPFTINSNTDGNTIEIRQNGEKFTNDKYNYKVVVTNDGNEIKHDFGAEAEPLIKQVADYTQRLEVCIQLPALRKQEGNNFTTRKIKVVPYWSNDDGVTWNEFYFNGMTDNEIELNVNHTVRFIAVKEFSASETFGKKIKIKLVKETPKAESGTDESCYLAYYQSFCYDNKLSSSTKLVRCRNITDELEDKLTRFGVTIKADASVNNYLDEFHDVAQAYAKIWNGASWSETKQPTSNPAAQVLEIRTSDAHIFSKYNLDEIDLNSLGELYEYCEENNYRVDALLTQGMKKQDLINKILLCCNAAEIVDRATGKYCYVIDKADKLPVGIINAENVTNLTVTKDLSRKPDGLKVTYNNSENWQIDTFFSMMNGGDKGINDSVQEFPLDYVTKYEHAYKLSQLKLRCNTLRLRLFSATMGLEARKYKLYDVVHLQHPSFRIGNASSTIINIFYDNVGNINKLELSDYITFESGKRYGIIINAVTQFGSQIIKREITGTGKTRVVTLVENISRSTRSGFVAPELFNLVSVGELLDGAFTSVTNTMIITNIEPNGEGYNLQLQDYNEDVYKVGIIPPYRSNITRPPMPSLEIPNQSDKGYNGNSGYNSRTIKLYIRSNAQPQDLPRNFTQYFSHGNLDATEEQLNGWVEGGAPITEDKAPSWFIYQTQVSQNDSAVFSNDGWSVPQIDSRDTQLSQAELQEMLEGLKDTSAPTVYASRTFASIAVDNNGIAPQTQEFDTVVHVLQSGQEIDFSFGEIVVPKGWLVTHIGNVVKFTVLAGTYVNSGNIAINVKYRAYLSNTAYADEMGDTYADENDIIYGSFVLANDETIYSLGFAYAEVRGGRYLNDIVGVISAISDIPQDIVIGDYFTWLGGDVSTQLSKDGQFLKSAVYKYDGELWEKSEDLRHLMPALSDVISVANSELKHNNSKAVQLFDRIVSNDVVTDSLTVTGTAFMNKVIAKTVASNSFISYVDNSKDEAIEGVLSNLGFKESDDVTIIQGGKIKTSKLNVNEITAGVITTDYLESGNARFKGFVEAKGFGLFVNAGDIVCLNSSANDKLVRKYIDICCHGSMRIKITNEEMIVDVYKNNTFIKRFGFGYGQIDVNVSEGDIFYFDDSNSPRAVIGSVNISLCFDTSNPLLKYLLKFKDYINE